MCVIVMIMIINLLAINSKMIRKENTIHTIQFIYNKRGWSKLATSKKAYSSSLHTNFSSVK